MQVRRRARRFGVRQRGALDGHEYRKFTNGADTADLAIGFRDGGSVTAVGFRLIPLGRPNSFELRVVEGDGAVTRVALGSLEASTSIGLSSDAGVSRAVITQRPEFAAGVQTIFSLDDVSRTHIAPRA